MGRIIAVSSGKGGVGKTTICINLAAALAHFGKSVIAVDANLTTSNLGIHLGIPLYPVTLQDVLKNRSRLHEALYYHHAGFRVLPADISVSKIVVPRKNEMAEIAYRLEHMADFILLDCAAGLGREARSALEAADELVTVTNPEMPALTEALKLATLAKRAETSNIGVVVNRVNRERHELTREEIEDFLEIPVLGHVYEDRHVREAVANKMPVVVYKPGSHAARQIKAIAANLAGEAYAPGFWARLLGRY